LSRARAGDPASALAAEQAPLERRRHGRGTIADAQFRVHVKQVGLTVASLMKGPEAADAA
jgi:hypothetical protein